MKAILTTLRRWPFFYRLSRDGLGLSPGNMTRMQSIRMATRNTWLWREMLLGLMLLALPAFGQQSTCVDTTMSATGRTLIAVPGGAFQYAASNFTYRTTGSPTGVSISIDAGNVVAATQTPFEKVAAVTDTSGADMGKANGPFRYWYANLATLSGGTTPTVILSSCFFRGTLISLTGSSGVVTGSGTSGTLAKFTGANAIGDSVLDESGGNLTTTGTFTSTGLTLSGATSGSATVGVTATGGGLLLNAAAGNVGIATTAPIARLQVVTANDDNPGSLGAFDGRHLTVGEAASSGALAFSYNQDSNIAYIQAPRPGTAFDPIVLQPAGSARVGIGVTPGTTLDVAGTTRSSLYSTTTNCSDSAGAAACAAAPAGSVVIDAAATTVVVSTTAVTADSQIFIQEDSSLNTRLSVTCNTTLGRTYAVTARTAATSFTITTSAAPVTNPACLNFFIIN